MDRKSFSESYQLGELVGDIIYDRYLPTLSTDMLKSNHIVEVTDKDDLDKFHKLEQILDNSYTFNGGDGNSTEAHKNWLDHVNTLADKYLTETIECAIPMITPSNMEEFKEGLRDYLWQTDMSWYMPEDNFFKPNSKYGIYSFIILTLTKND